MQSLNSGLRATHQSRVQPTPALFNLSLADQNAHHRAFTYICSGANGVRYVLVDSDSENHLDHPPVAAVSGFAIRVFSRLFNRLEIVSSVESFL